MQKKTAFPLQLNIIQETCWITWWAWLFPLQTRCIWHRLQVCRSSQTASCRHQRQAESGHLRKGGENTHTLKDWLWFQAVFLSLLMAHLPITGLSFKGCRLSWGKAAQQQPVRSKHTRVRKPASAIVLSWPSVVALCRICSRLIYRKSSWKRIWSVEGSEESPRLSYMSWMQLHVHPRLTVDPIWFFCWQNGLFGKVSLILCCGNRRDVRPKSKFCNRVSAE